jgi:hypothetical protein
MLASARFAPDVGPLRFHLDVKAVLHDVQPQDAERPYVDTPIHLVLDGRVELRRGLLDADLRLDGGRAHERAHVVQIVEYAYARVGGRWYRIAPVMPTLPVRPAAVAAVLGDREGLFSDIGTNGADGVGGSLALKTLARRVVGATSGGHATDFQLDTDPDLQRVQVMLHVDQDDQVVRGLDSTLTFAPTNAVGPTNRRLRIDVHASWRPGPPVQVAPPRGSLDRELVEDRPFLGYVNYLTSFWAHCMFVHCST